jgi:ribosomal protein S18 acetylase RimI-like enzyme
MANISVVFRRAHIDDFDNLVKTHSICFGDNLANYDFEIWINSRWCYVACIDNRCVGYVTFIPIGVKHYILDHVGILPEFRKQGLAARLCEFAAQHYRGCLIEADSISRAGRRLLKHLRYKKPRNYDSYILEQQLWKSHQS